MAAYLMVQIRIAQQTESWPAYRAAVGPLAQRFGGHYIVAGGAKVEILEGAHDGRSLVVFEFSSMDDIRRFWQSPEYGEVKKLREGAAVLDAWAVPGV